MEKSLVIRVCEHFYEEISHVLESSPFPNVKCVAFQARCGRPPLALEELQQNEHTYQIILGSSCLFNLKRCQNIPNSKLIHFDYCFQMIAPEAVVEYLVLHRSFITSPGWLLNWRETIKIWGDENSIRDMFHETINNIVMLDTGVYENTENEIDEFARYLDVPYSKILIGMDYCRLYILDLLHQWYNQPDNNKDVIALKNNQKEMANHAMALDLLGTMPVLDSREAVFQNMTDVLMQLFAPEYIHGLSYVDGFPESFRTTLTDEFDKEESWDRLAEYEGSGYTADQTGFYFSVRDNEDILLMLELNHCAIPSDIPQYLNLCDVISGVLALSVSNARTYVKLQEALDKVDTLRGIIPICSHCKQIRTDQGAWQQIERYISTHSLAEFSHSICPACMDKYYPEVAEKMKKKKEFPT